MIESMANCNLNLYSLQAVKLIIIFNLLGEILALKLDGKHHSKRLIIFYFLT